MVVEVARRYYGNRLIRKDASGSTLYLPEGVEVHVDAAGGNATSTRYYSFGGETVAVRTAAGLSFLGSDHHGTASVSVNAVSGAATARRSDPFGGPRGGVPVWPGERGFVGGTVDAVTGLTHLGAREYDPWLGRFVSVDPLMDPSDPQQVDGYNYADANPVTNADPLGEQCTNGPDGMCRTPSGANIPTQGVSEQGGIGPPIEASSSLGHLTVTKSWSSTPCNFGCRVKSAGRAAGQAVVDWQAGGGISSPSYGAGVADGLANAAYVPARMVVCHDMATACDDIGLPATVHIPLDGDTSSGGYKVGYAVATLATFAIPGGATAKIAATADRAATTAVTATRITKATEGARAAAGHPPLPATVRIFRNVEGPEFAAVATTGKWELAPGGMSVKWFATRGEHAETWGTKLNGGNGLTLETSIPRSVFEQLHAHQGGKLDGIGPAVGADADQLERVNGTMDGIRMWP